MIEKTLDNLEIGDNIKAPGGAKYIVVTLVNKCAVLANNQQGGGCTLYSVQYLKDNKWVVEAPLTKLQQVAKDTLEAIGFKVTR